MTEFEREILQRFLQGEDPILDILRTQLFTAKVRQREVTETGFFTDLWIDDAAPVVERANRFALDDVFGEIEGVDESVCFLLHVHRGRLRTLEGFLLGAPWPSHPRLLRAWYVHPDPAQAGLLVECPTRNLDFALRGAASGPDGDTH